MCQNMFCVINEREWQYKVLFISDIENIHLFFIIVPIILVQWYMLSFINAEMFHKIYWDIHAQIFLLMKNKIRD